MMEVGGVKKIYQGEGRDAPEDGCLHDVFASMRRLVGGDVEVEMPRD